MLFGSYKMLFRMTDGEVAEVKRTDYGSSAEYCDAIMEVYGLKLPSDAARERDDLSQLDFIYGLMTRQQPSRL